MKNCMISGMFWKIDMYMVLIVDSYLFGMVCSMLNSDLMISVMI